MTKETSIVKRSKPLNIIARGQHQEMALTSVLFLLSIQVGLPSLTTSRSLGGGGHGDAGGVMCHDVTCRENQK